ncbi:MAG: hypothetical protein PUB73_05530 [Bacteroidales bacterium]|nr:hypothetical protein [Bacteroidales bacterium]
MRANYNPRKEHSIRKRYGFKNPKKSFLIICVDDRDYLASLIKAAIPALPKPKVKKRTQ